MKDDLENLKQLIVLILTQNGYSVSQHDVYNPCVLTQEFTTVLIHFDIKIDESLKGRKVLVDLVKLFRGSNNSVKVWGKD